MEDERDGSACLHAAKDGGRCYAEGFCGTAFEPCFVPGVVVG
jgi:hypothetical protein